MKKRLSGKKRRWIFLAAAALVLAAYFACTVLALRGHQEKINAADIRQEEENRSRIILTGKNYYLEDEDAGNYLKEEKELLEQRETKPEEPELPQPEEQKETARETESSSPREEFTTETRRSEPSSENPTEPSSEEPTDPEPSSENPQEPSTEKPTDPEPLSEEPEEPSSDEPKTKEDPTEPSSEDPAPEPSSEEKPTQEKPSDAPESPSGERPSGEPGPSGGGEEDPTDPSEPPSENKQPLISTDISGEPYGTDPVFSVRGTTWQGNVIENFYYTVTLDGTQLYSSGSSGGWTAYGAYDVPEGEHSVYIRVEDPVEQTTAEAWYLLTVAASQNVPTEERVYLTLEAQALGFGILLQTSDYIYKGENAAHFVKRVLEANGFSPAIDEGSSYLSRIYRWGIKPGEPEIPENLKTYLGDPYADADPDSLGERDYYATSGWIYLLNGEFQGVGLYGVILQDGDEIHLGFAPMGGDEYSGNVYYYGQW